MYSYIQETNGNTILSIKYMWINLPPSLSNIIFADIVYLLQLHTTLVKVTCIAESLTAGFNKLQIN
jgi:hypothetical protein